jgi:hypothetical protein
MCKSSGKVLRYLALLLALHTGFSGSRAVGQDVKAAGEDLAERLLKQRNEVIIRFVMPGVTGIAFFTDFLSIDKVQQDTVTAYANEAGFRQFLTTGLPYEVLQPPSLPAQELVKRHVSADWHERYPRYDEYLSLMEGFATDHPGLCKLVQFGTSVQGRKLCVIKITDNPEVREDEPVFLYSSTMHGDEVTGYVLMLRLIEELLVNYETDTAISRLVDNVEIWINPLANPDGTYHDSDTSVAGATRFNANATDLNRDFPDVRESDYTTTGRQPETIAMMKLMEGMPLVLAANFHGGIEVVNYPWDTWSRWHADDTWYRQVSRKYADVAQDHGPAGYMDDLDNGITNGYTWYVAYGTRQDYSNYFLHAREVTIELSTEKMPVESSLGVYWNANRQSLIRFIRWTLTGIRGAVTDSVSGLPLKAEVSIRFHDFDNSQIISSAEDGNYIRLLLPGFYPVIISAPDYQPQLLYTDVKSGVLTERNVRLKPYFIHFSLYPNPFTDLLKIYVPESGNTMTIEFTDVTGRKAKIISWPVTSAGLQEIAVSSLSPGVYVVGIIYGSMRTNQVLVKAGGH